MYLSGSQYFDLATSKKLINKMLYSFAVVGPVGSDEGSPCN